MEVVPVDSNVATNWHFAWSNESIVFVYIFVLSSLQKWSLDDTRILLGWLEDWNGVISQVEWNDKSPIDVLWYFCIESSCVSQDFFVIIDVFEEVNLWLLGYEIINITKGIDFISKSVMWWYLNDYSISWLWSLDLWDWEVTMISAQKIVLGEFINTSNAKGSSIGNEFPIVFNLITSQISISDKLLSWLIYGESLWELLSSKVHWERVSSVIWEMDLSDFNSIISQEIVPLELKICGLSEES